MKKDISVFNVIVEQEFSPLKPGIVRFLIRVRLKRRREMSGLNISVAYDRLGANGVLINRLPVLV